MKFLAWPGCVNIPNKLYNKVVINSVCGRFAPLNALYEKLGTLTFNPASPKFLAMYI